MPISSETDLANLALAMIGSGSVSTINDQSKQAITCKRFLDLAVRKALSRGEFSASVKREELTLLNQWVRPDYQYQYQLPSDYIKGLYLDSSSDYEIEGGFLYTSESTHNVTRYRSGVTTIESSNPVLVYVAYPKTFQTLQPYVADFVAAQLAAMIAPDLLNDMNKVALAKQNLQESYIFAKSHNLSEKKGKADKPSQWGDFMSGTVNS